MTYDQFIKEYIVAGQTYTSDEVIALIQQAWVQAVNEQVQLEGRCTNKKYSPWSCRDRDFHFTRHHDCPTPPDRECVHDCLRRCPPIDHIWHPSNTSLD
jgi:hypothetical protein